MPFHPFLNASPLSWLLEPDAANPGVRYFALVELLDKRLDDPEVRQARSALMKSGPVPHILEAQYPEGYWVKPGGGYSPKYRSTVWQVILLAELGADPGDERVRQGCLYLLGHSIAANGAFSVYRKPVASGAFHCLNGNLLLALQRLGFGQDDRVRRALHWQALAITGEADQACVPPGTSGPAFACRINYDQPCAWGAAKAMRGLLAVSQEGQTPAIQRAIEAGVDFLFSRDPALADYPYSGRVSSTWFKLGFPLSYWSDVLEVVSVLVEAGHGDDPRLASALNFIREKQDAHGRWRLENSLNGKMWTDIERRGQPSKWVTLRVMRMLKGMGLTLNEGHGAGSKA